MRADNRRLTAVAATLLAVTLPSLCFPSAAGDALWSKVDFSAFTTLGILQVKLGTARDEAGLRLDQVHLAADGEPLRIPPGVDLRLRDPQLNSVKVITTRSITCIDECLDPRGWPISLNLLFGDYSAAKDGESECGYSLLVVDIDEDGISEITRWNCIDGRQEEHVLYERKSAGDH